MASPILPMTPFGVPVELPPGAVIDPAVPLALTGVPKRLPTLPKGDAVPEAAAAVAGRDRSAAAGESTSCSGLPKASV